MITVKISKPYRLWVYAAFALSWVSGVVFFVLHTWFMVEGEFGLVKHPLQFPSLQVHGFAAFVMMVTYGFFLGTHVKHAWKVKPLRIFGLLLLLFPALLMISGYLLYYVAEDVFRDWVRYFHLGIGFILPFTLAMHVYRNRKRKRTT